MLSACLFVWAVVGDPVWIWIAGRKGRIFSSGHGSDLGAKTANGFRLVDRTDIFSAFFCLNVKLVNPHHSDLSLVSGPFQQIRIPTVSVLA